MTASATIDAAPKRVRAGETVLIGVDCQYWGLASGVTLSGPTTADADGLTIASLAVNTATFQNDQKGTCAIGKGLQFLVSGQVAGSEYTVVFSVATSNGQTLRPAVTLVGV
jgi:hypothetical protein